MTKRLWSPVKQSLLSNLLESPDDTDSDPDYLPTPCKNIKRGKATFEACRKFTLNKEPEYGSSNSRNEAFRKLALNAYIKRKQHISPKKTAKEPECGPSDSPNEACWRLELDNTQNEPECGSSNSQNEACWRLELDNTQNEPECGPSNSQNEVLLELENREKLYLEQLRIAQINGSKSTTKRKAKRLSQLRQFMTKAKCGSPIDLGNVPNPNFSPQKKVLVDGPNSSSFSSPTSGYENTVENENTLEKVTGTKPLRKANFCIECKKFVREFCKHYESVHKNTPEGIKLNQLNSLTDKTEKKKLKRAITDMLRKKGNAYYVRSQNDDTTLIAVKKSKKPASDSNTVQCKYCEGFYNRRKFSQHLKKCEVFLNTNANCFEGTTNTILGHSLPIFTEIPGASKELINEVILKMKTRQAKEVALKDKLIMQYASEFQKTRRCEFQQGYVSRIITDLSKLLLRMQEKLGEQVNCLEDIFNPAHFQDVVESILEEGGYDKETGSVIKCGLGNRLRSHIKGAAETAKSCAMAEEYKENPSMLSLLSLKRKRIKHFLKMLEEKWANEVGRIFDSAAKQSRAENGKKIAAEEDIIKTCQYVSSQYDVTIKNMEEAQSGSLLKQQHYNTLLDLIVTHVMCLIRRRPVDFKRGKNIHYEKLDKQEELLEELKTSERMGISKEDLELCRRFHVFYVPGKGWKELVPITLTPLMKRAMDAIQRTKGQVGITSDTLFVRAREMPINPRESLRKVTKHLKLKKPLDLSGNGLRHHAATFSKLHSNHPNYQDYLASALGHSLHIHKLHYELPASIIQKLIVLPVLENMTKPPTERQIRPMQSKNLDIDSEEDLPIKSLDQSINPTTSLKSATATQNENTPKKISIDYLSDNSYGSSEEINLKEKNAITRLKWTNQEKKLIYKVFGETICIGTFPPRSKITEFYNKNQESFKTRSLQSIVTFIHNKCFRKQKNVTPEVKKFLSNVTPEKNVTHRRLTNVPL